MVVQAYRCNESEGVEKDDNGAEVLVVTTHYKLVEVETKLALTCVCVCVCVCV